MSTASSAPSRQENRCERRTVEDREGEINARGAYVSVEVTGDGADLDEVKAVAHVLWQESRLDDGRAGPAVGFQGEINGQWDHDRQSGRFARPVRAEADQPVGS